MERAASGRLPHHRRPVGARSRDGTRADGPSDEGVRSSVGVLASEVDSTTFEPDEICFTATRDAAVTTLDGCRRRRPRRVVRRTRCRALIRLRRRLNPLRRALLAPTPSRWRPSTRRQETNPHNTSCRTGHRLPVCYGVWCRNCARRKSVKSASTGPCETECHEQAEVTCATVAPRPDLVSRSRTACAPSAPARRAAYRALEPRGIAFSRPRRPRVAARSRSTIRARGGGGAWSLTSARFELEQLVRLVEGHPALAHQVRREHRRRPASSLGAVDQHRPTVGQLLVDPGHGVGQHLRARDRDVRHAERVGA